MKIKVDIEKLWPENGVNPTALLSEICDVLAAAGMSMEDAKSAVASSRVLGSKREKSGAFTRGILEIDLPGDISKKQRKAIDNAMASHDGTVRSGWMFDRITGAKTIEPMGIGRIVFVSNARRGDERKGEGTGNLLWWDPSAGLWRRVDNGDDKDLI